MAKSKKKTKYPKLTRSYLEKMELVMIDDLVAGRIKQLKRQAKQISEENLVDLKTVESLKGVGVLEKLLKEKKYLEKKVAKSTNKREIDHLNWKIDTTIKAMRPLL